MMDGQGNFFSIRPAGNRAQGWRCHGWRLGAQAHRLEHQKLSHLFLRGLGNEVERFCSPTTMEMDGGKLTMVAQLGQLLATVWATSGASPAAMTAPAGAMDLGEPLRAIISARIVVKWCGGDEARSLARWQEKVA
jgi:hypothetical protein